MSKQRLIQFSIHIRSIKLQKKGVYPLNLSFTLLNGMRKNGQINCIINNFQEDPIDFSYTKPMTFKYVHDIDNQEEMNIQLIVSDQNKSQQIDSLTLSALEILTECEKNEFKVIYHWRIPDEMDIQYEAVTFIKSNQQEFMRTYSPVKNKQPPAKSLMISKELKKRQNPPSHTDEINKLTQIFHHSSQRISQHQQHPEQQQITSVFKSRRVHRNSRKLDHHQDHHKHHHGHEQVHGHHEGLSKKMKFVVFMLIFGLCFMIYHLATSNQLKRRVKNPRYSAFKPQTSQIPKGKKKNDKKEHHH